jgi:hypothetical protein
VGASGTSVARALRPLNWVQQTPETRGSVGGMFDCDEARRILTSARSREGLPKVRLPS